MHFFCDIETNMQMVAGKREVLLVGRVPQADVPTLFQRPYRGVPQFDLHALNAMQNFEGPQPFVGGRLFAPPEQHARLAEIAVNACPYASTSAHEPRPLASHVDGAPVSDLEDGHRTPLKRAIAARERPG